MFFAKFVAQNKLISFINMRHLLYYVFAVALICGCSKGQKLSEIKAIESIIQENPELARSKLSSFDCCDCTAKEKALYSLLRSMAEDKCYNDITSDSLIAPAVTYYSHLGDRYHKFLTFYYQGRVYENAGDYLKATNAYICSENYIDAANDEYKVRLFAAKERVYLNQFAQDKALEEVFKAKKFPSHLIIRLISYTIVLMLSHN